MNANSPGTNPARHEHLVLDEKAIEAAANGFGHASVPSLLAAKDIAEGRVRQVGKPRESDRAYWLIAPLPQWRQKKVKALVEALAAG